MKHFLPISLSLYGILFLSSCACVPLRKYHDKRVSKYINRNLPAVYALGDSLRAIANNNDGFLADSLTNRHFPKKMKMLGDEVTVYFREGYPYNSVKEPCDSVVLIERMSILLGVREIIYDFSIRERSFKEDLNYGNYYSFKKAAPKVYIRRRQIPMM